MSITFPRKLTSGRQEVRAIFDDNFRRQVEILRRAPELFQASSEVTPHEPAKPPRLTQRTRFLLERIPERSRVLDLGSGPGEISYYLQHEKYARVLCVERVPEYIQSCRERGLLVVNADMNNIEDPALCWAISQKWDVVIAIDTALYWRYPAAVLAALSDRVGKIFITIGNTAHIRRRLNALAGKMDAWPNCRPGKDDTLEFDLSWGANRWTLEGFTRWAEALGYDVRLIARRSVSAAYKRLGPLPSLFVRAFLFELTPRADLPL